MEICIQIQQKDLEINFKVFGMLILYNIDHLSYGGFAMDIRKGDMCNNSF